MRLKYSNSQKLSAVLTVISVILHLKFAFGPKARVKKNVE